MLAEDEMQTSSAEDGIKSSEVVPDAIRTETVDSQSFKVPLKRKKTKDDVFLKVAKKVETNEVMNEEEEEVMKIYLTLVVCFLRLSIKLLVMMCLTLTVSEDYKNKRNVNVENYFPNTQLLVERSRSLMSEGCFTDREVYRLKKIVRRLTADLSNNDSV